ncbi:MAG: hypothetical protein OEL85_10160, partial [Desulfobulbaceae bacterium]|nr:hypothetical protein [Desulfobulbaceae bacterium]
WENYENLNFSTNFAVLRTSKTKVNLGYRINTNKDDTINNLNCNWSWNISPYLTFNTNGNYTVTENDNIWSVNAYLSARF